LDARDRQLRAMQREIEELKGRRLLRRSQERGREEKVRELEEAVRELGRMVLEREQSK